MVAAHTDAALAEATDVILQTRTSPMDGVTTVRWVDRQSQRARIDSTGPDGPMYAHALTPVPAAPAGTYEVLVVDHGHRAWWRHTVTPPTDGPSGVARTPSYEDPAEIRDAIANGDLTLVGTEQLDGREAWHLRVTDLRLGTSLTIDIWVDPQTYLPRRIVGTSARGAVATVTIEFTWLPRTAENLAMLDLVVPPDYTYHDRPILPEPGQPVG